MAEVIKLDKRDGYVYDVVIKQYDTNFWKSVTSLPTISSNLLRFNAAEAASYLQHIFADVEFKMTVPAAPTSGDARYFGFKNPAGTGLGAVYFDITNAVFSLKIYDDFGNLYSKVLTWSSGYTNTPTLFRIRWEKDGINVLINNVLVASIPQTTTGQTTGKMPPTGPVSISIKNANSDNMDMTYMRVRRAASII